MTNWMHATIGELLGEPEGTPPSDRTLGLIRLIINGLEPGYKWYVDRSYFNYEVDITMSNPYEMRGTSLFLDNDVSYGIHHVILTLTHHHEWHKGLSIGGITIKPYEWYPQLAEQQKYMREHPEYAEKVYREAGVWKQVNELKGIIKDDNSKSIQ